MSSLSTHACVCVSEGEDTLRVSFKETVVTLCWALKDTVGMGT